MFVDVETLRLIQGTAQQAQTAKVVQMPAGDGRKVLIQQGDKLIDHEVPPDLRKHTVGTLDDLIAYANRLPGEGDVKRPTRVFWHGATGVTLVLDDDDRRDRVTFPLTMTKRFLLLGELTETRRGYDQASFLKLLRFDLGVDDFFVNKFRAMKWETANMSEADMQKQGDRFGGSASAGVKGVSELPETLTISTPIYREIGEQEIVAFSCDVDFNFTQKQIFLLPKEEDLDKAVADHQADLRCRLEKSVPKEFAIYFGAP